MELMLKEDGFALYVDGRLLLLHSYDEPCAYLGQGREEITMHRGNFSIKDELVSRIPLRNYEITKHDQGYTILLFHINKNIALEIEVYQAQGRYRLVTQGSPEFNRCWLRLHATAEEYVYGGGEQYSHFNLRGKKFPIFVTEQGVGRNKKTLTTFQADCHDGGGGDYWTTYFPQPTFISSRKYYCHAANLEYQELNFAHPNYHELYLWGTEYDLTLETAPTFTALLTKLTGLLGRQPVLPEWAYEGAWLGIQGGTEVCRAKLDKMRAAGAKVNVIWAQDWVGHRFTSFGKRLMWNWVWNRELYPDLDRQITTWKEEGVRFTAYVNPYLAVEGSLFAEAQAKGYLVKNRSGEVYLVDFGEFFGGIVDLTNPQAADWFSDLIAANLIELGISGWMADFGEYLPTDAVLFNGEDPVKMHNQWPVLWAKVNHTALVKAGKLGEIVFFMRAGFSGSQKYATAIWAGDQNVDWSLDDGLASVIPAALSLGMSGYGIHSSDIGGYTTLYGMKRTKELFQRWTELAIFTPIMRTHEGNRPAENWQFDSDAETISHFAWATKIHAKLKPYIKALLQENGERGIPLMRPLFLHYEEDPQAYALQYQYLFGRDLLVAPIYKEGQQVQQVYLPADEWVYLWGEGEFGQGWVEMEAPIGRPAVFYRKHSPYQGLFAGIKGCGAWKK